MWEGTKDREQEPLIALEALSPGEGPWAKCWGGKFPWLGMHPVVILEADAWAGDEMVGGCFKPCLSRWDP